MHVPVEDEDALDAGKLAQPLGDAGDRVEEAEPHRLGAVGVVAGRARDDERALRSAALPDLLGRSERGRDGGGRGGVALARDRVVVGVEDLVPVAAGRLELARVVAANGPSR